MSIKAFDFWCKVHKYFSIKDTIELFIDILKDCTEDAFKILYLTRDYKNGKGLKKHSIAILTYLRFVLDNDALKKHIEQHGKVIYERRKKGKTKNIIMCKMDTQ